MTPQGRHLLRVLALLLLVQWVAALQPCLRSVARLSTAQWVTLCSPAGTMRALLVDQDGRPVPKAMPGMGCPLCQTVTAALPPVPPMVPARPPGFVVLARQATRAGLPPLPARAPPQQPRAPPTA